MRAATILSAMTAEHEACATEDSDSPDPLAALSSAVALAARPVASAQPESNARANHSGRRPRARRRIGLDRAGTAEAAAPAPRRHPRVALPRASGHRPLEHRRGENHSRPAPEGLVFRVHDHSTRHARAAWTRRSEEHTSELQSLMRISYAGFFLKKKKKH